MGISDAIARVREGVKKGGLPAVMAELGGQLRSDAIPAPFRPAASRLATLLRVPETRREVVSLRDAHVAHGLDASLAGGACPFTGLRSDGSLAEEPALETSTAAEMPFVPELADAAAPATSELSVPALEEPAVVDELADAKASELSESAATRGTARDRGDEETVVAVPRRRSQAPAAQSERPPAKKKPEPPASRKSVPPKSAATKPAPEKATSRDKEKVAAKAGAANSSARPSAKSAAKRSSAKATSKKK